MDTSTTTSALDALRTAEFRLSLRGYDVDEVARLEGMRQRLGEDVERMSNQLETERSRLTGSLHDLLGWIEKNIQPAASLAALRSPATVGATNGQTVGAGAAQVLSMDEARREE